MFYRFLNHISTCSLHQGAKLIFFVTDARQNKLVCSSVSFLGQFWYLGFKTECTKQENIRLAWKNFQIQILASLVIVSPWVTKKCFTMLTTDREAQATVQTPPITSEGRPLRSSSSLPERPPIYHRWYKDRERCHPPFRRLSQDWNERRKLNGCAAKRQASL